MRPLMRAQFPSRSCAIKNEGPVIGSLALHWRKLKMCIRDRDMAGRDADGGAAVFDGLVAEAAYLFAAGVGAQQGVVTAGKYL